MRKLSGLALLLIIAPLAGACRSSSSSTPDAHVGPDSSAAPDALSGPDGGNAACTVYTPTSIAALRQGTQSGCFEFDNVVSIGTTPSTGSPKLFVQDAGGGNFSAIMTRCSSTSTAHPCSVAATVAAIVDSRSVTIKGTYIKSKSSGFESFYIDSITDNGAGTMPTPGAAVLADIERGSTGRGLVFQRVTATISANDTLQMYDWTPGEFVYSGATKCPYQFGFGMLPKSVTGTATGACSGTTSQPPGQASPNAAEVLIGTDFYKGFTVSSDCQCAATFSDKEPATGSKVVGAIGGILVFDVPFGGTTGYIYLAPKTGTDFPISGTI